MFAMNYRCLVHCLTRQVLWTHTQHPHPPTPVADPGFPRDAARTPESSASTYYFEKKMRKTAWKWKNLGSEGARVLGTPLDPALHPWNFVRISVRFYRVVIFLDIRINNGLAHRSDWHNFWMKDTSTQGRIQGFLKGRCRTIKDRVTVVKATKAIPNVKAVWSSH